MSVVQPRPTAERLELAAKVAGLREQGFTYREVAARLGISKSHASMLATDPDGAKVCARREGYKGVCERCGGETKSDGTSRPSRVCAACAVERQRESKYWTRELVIEAIRAWAAEHGRPPCSTDWTYADPDGRRPSKVSVYRSTPDSSSPFVLWADAIEAAGFPRPDVGGYERTDEFKQRISEATMRWDNDAITAAFCTYHDRYGFWPRTTVYQFPGHGLPSYATVFKRFGSWQYAIAAAQAVA